MNSKIIEISQYLTWLNETYAKWKNNWWAGFEKSYSGRTGTSKIDAKNAYYAKWNERFKNEIQVTKRILEGAMEIKCKPPEYIFRKSA